MHCLALLVCLSPSLLLLAASARIPRAGKLGAGDDAVSMNEDPGTMSCDVLPPAVVRFLPRHTHNGGQYMATKNCDPYCDGGIAMATFSGTWPSMLYHPERSQFTIEGDAQVGSIIRLRQASDDCYVGTCGAGCLNNTGKKLVCHRESHRLFLKYPTRYQWKVQAGSWCNGASVQLMNVNGDCFAGMCSIFTIPPISLGEIRMDPGEIPPSHDAIQTESSCRYEGESQMGCAQAGVWPYWHTWMGVEHPGPVVGKWIFVNSGQGVLQPVSYTVGKTLTDGRSIDETVSRTLGGELGSQIGFSDILGGVISMSTTHTMSQSYSYSMSLDRSETSNITCEIAADGRKHWVWQWVIEVPTWEGRDPITAQARTKQAICTACPDSDLFCKGPITPRCPLDWCSNVDCTTCHEP